MIAAVAGIRAWANAVWRGTCDVHGSERASAWLARMALSVPRLNRQTDWQAALASVLPSGETADIAAARPSHRAMPAAPVVEQSVRRRLQVPEAALVQQALTKTNANDRTRSHAMPEAASAAAAAAGESAALTRTSRRARRTRSSAPLPVAIVDASALADVLKIYAPRGVTVAFSSRHDHISPRPSAPARAIEIPSARREWPSRVARRAARRLVDSGTVTSDHARSLQSIENEIAVALVQTLDMGVAGMRIEPLALPGTTTPAGATPSPSPEPGSSPFAPLERPPLSNPAAVAPSAVADPLHPIGFSSAASAPAPDIPVSVMSPPAGSINRVAPPSGVPSLPPLIPASVTQPPAFGISAPTMRQATRPEDADAPDEDAAVLASRIRRILRDEARRHGISLQ